MTVAQIVFYRELHSTLTRQSLALSDTSQVPCIDNFTNSYSQHKFRKEMGR